MTIITVDPIIENIEIDPRTVANMQIGETRLNGFNTVSEFVFTVMDGDVPIPHLMTVFGMMRICYMLTAIGTCESNLEGKRHVVLITDDEGHGNVYDYNDFLALLGSR